MARRVGTYSSGVQAVAKSSGMVAAIARATEAVAENARSMGVRVGDRDGGPRERDIQITTQVVITDRAHGIVAAAHPSGEAVQAKHGLLTKAAAQAGLDVKQ